MSIAYFLKNNLKNIPPSIGGLINTIPYSLRPGMGSIYRKRKNEIDFIDNASIDTKHKFVFERTQKLVMFAYKHISFYRNFYDENNFSPDQLRSFEDLQRIPIINKQILQSVDLEYRSFKAPGRYIVNTGGSSGTPFSFFIEPNSMGHEWAHMHKIWGKFGYREKDLKLTFGGRSDVKHIVDYDVVRNHFAIDIYSDFDLIAHHLFKILKKYKIKYLHGYPSSIYEFAKYCEQNNPKLREVLSTNLIGAFLGSEYPHRQYRDEFERIFGIDSVSWYGHTERAILAYEKNTKYQYSPFLTYGFCEIEKNSENEFELLGTSYYNFASPLIRYNTGDIVSDPIIEEGILNSFQVKKGRVGEFIVDKNGNRINLTGLIFGRHHELFNCSKFIQVRQIEDGKITIHYVSDIDVERASDLFDKSNLNVDIKFQKEIEPIRTISGKVNLLIK